MSNLVHVDFNSYNLYINTNCTCDKFASKIVLLLWLSPVQPCWKNPGYFLKKIPPSLIAGD